MEPFYLPRMTLSRAKTYIGGVWFEEWDSVLAYVCGILLHGSAATIDTMVKIFNVTIDLILYTCVSNQF
jgi:hypothetical protein